MITLLALGLVNYTCSIADCYHVKNNPREYMMCIQSCNQNARSRELQEEEVEEERKQTRILKQQLEEQKRLEQQMRNEELLESDR